MSGLRAPVVSGVAGGVGVTTLAVALRAHDAGRAGVEAADILACRGTLDSLRRAAAVLERPGGAPAPPVLAVTLDGARLPRGPVRARLELLDAAVSAVVLLPHVSRWRTTADPLPEVAQLLAEPAERLPRPLRAYAAALRELAAAVAASGRLRVGRPPDPAVPRAALPVRAPPTGPHRGAAGRPGRAGAEAAAPAHRGPPRPAAVRGDGNRFGAAGRRVVPPGRRVGGARGTGRRSRGAAPGRAGAAVAGRADRPRRLAAARVHRSDRAGRVRRCASRRPCADRCSRSSASPSVSHPEAT